MKTVRITTKSKAAVVKNAHLESKVTKYCSGKYRPDADFVGRELQTSDNVLVVWEERRSDSHGKFKVLRCLVTS